jgi:hypothetical protein
VSTEENLKQYTFKTFVDWLFKKSPVTYFIGGVLGIAGLVLSGGLTVDLSDNAIKLVYSNEITVISILVVLACLFISYGALKMQMKERYSKLMSEKESKLLKEKHDLQSAHEKNLEVLKSELELEKKKSANTHSNVGTASNRLLKKITRLEGIFAGYIGSAQVQPKMVDNVQVDIFIANAINDQHKYRHIYDGDEALKYSWNQMLKYLDESQKAIARSFHGAPLDTVPLSQAALYMSKHIQQVSSSGHELEI